MNSLQAIPFFFAIYLLLPLCCGVVLLLVGIKKKGERPPLEFVLRRAPGESLRRKLAKMDEELPLYLLGIALFPLLLCGLALALAKERGDQAAIIALSVSGILILLGMAGICFWTLWFFKRRRNYLLGYLGERAVAEDLEALVRDGFYVFHDVPVEKVQGSFNLDHVVVGPTGLYAIETKTRRKGRARAGYEAHKVFYDGRQLIWPWAEDSHGLNQAKRQAEWLSNWIKQMTGISLSAKPILALPGWYVENRASGPISVQNPKNLAANIRGKGIQVLDDSQIYLILKQLDARCRDVKD